ncbi:BBE domain-containing protein, partial [Micromonospora echinofusca]
FGVVTSLTFDARPAPRMTNFYVVWDFQDAAELLKAWQRWSVEVPEEMTAGLGFTAMDDLDDPAVAEVFGAMVGTESDAMKLIGELVERCGREPASVNCREMDYRETGLYQAGLLSAVNNQVIETPQGHIERQGCRFTKGEFFDRPIPDEAVDRLAEVFLAGRTAGEVRGLELAPWGGGYARTDRHATAFVHRDTSFSLKHAVMVAPEATQAQKEAAYRWVSQSWGVVHPWGSNRVYPNFPDPDLVDWGTAYYGENFARLKRVKSQYDPGNLFRFEQSIPLG